MYTFPKEVEKKQFQILQLNWRSHSDLYYTLENNVLQKVAIWTVVYKKSKTVFEIIWHEANTPWSQKPESARTDVH